MSGVPKYFVITFMTTEARLDEKPGAVVAVLGRRVKKLFPGFGDFYGVVTEYLKPEAGEQDLWKVVYDDGWCARRRETTTHMTIYNR